MSSKRTIFEAYNKLKRDLISIGIEDTVFEAKQIIKHITGFTNREILEFYGNPLTDEQEDELDSIVKMRADRYPLQYALGSWSCFGYEFKVGPGVLIPRSDTETIIETALELIKDKKDPFVLDLCSGSGCIGISIALENKSSTVTLVEKYPEAALYSQENITLNRAFNATLKIGDVTEGAQADKKYDIIVSNPPYVTADEMKSLQKEVTFEPETALFGGEDGLDFYKIITKKYKSSLKEGGILCFEIGFKQADAVSGILKDAGFKNVTVKRDIEQRDRVVFGTV